VPPHRIHLTLHRDAAARLYPAVESAFEEEGHPLALIEVGDDDLFQELSVYVETEEDALSVSDRLAAIRSEHGLDAPIGTEPLGDVDWVARSLEGLSPVRAGRFLVHGSHDRDKRRIGDIGIEIEAGLAFGTGHHGTTAGCLEMIGRVVRNRRPRNALDLGTGSAVLAIAIARLAPIGVLATDIDPVATRVAAENARLNGVGGRIEAVTATGFHHPAFARRGPFDLVVANILARPLMQLAPAMRGHVAPGGSVVLSGILAGQRRAVIAAYVGQHFRHVSTLWREGWVTLLLTR
jgi:ribosomal protein L11 methyltransferase